MPAKKSLVQKTHNKNGKSLTTYQKVTSTGLSNNGRNNMTQQEKMKVCAQTYKEYNSDFINPEKFLPSKMNEFIPDNSPW